MAWCKVGIKNRQDVPAMRSPLTRLRRENEEGRICHPCEIKPEIRFVRAIDQNKTSSLGTVAAAVAAVALSEAIR